MFFQIVLNIFFFLYFYINNRLFALNIFYQDDGVINQQFSKQKAEPLNNQTVLSAASALLKTEKRKCRRRRRLLCVQIAK